ncbi:cation diffusion facilitator family transporter [Alicyclobacillus acidocaldarius]|uniref:Cation diffusion facilitator family transporter n=1 Tax=Alicyclobacillus acidocaldarius (strain Tc-4-1) TaxID=1048834 RepID=F8IE55_ALIAT|nr:cation diffusion facilitator family transporter [Alicyclobacillus acidocaldarius]AEJ43897.1 cation diffusion facilitator family transporter [Alicyclobacillus acidocaldarius subsp. acidocaldarius Tc-4-1]
MSHSYDEHPHGHHHAHGGGHVHEGEWLHVHAPADKMRLAFWLTALVFLAEVLGGVVSGSLALLSDAGHVLTDMAALGLSWYALRQAERPSDARMTFGYHRAGILAALLNALLLLGVTVWVMVEAWNRLQHPRPIEPLWMSLSALVGVIVNLGMAVAMRGEDNLNVQSAVLHMLGDMAASLGVIAAGAVIAWTHWEPIDPILSVAIALAIAYGAIRLAGRATRILMEGAPADVNARDVVNAILTVEGVRGVHDLHIWSIANGRNALSCHVEMDGVTTVSETQGVIREIEHRLRHLNIGHVTVQVEDEDHPHEPSVFCAQAHQEMRHGEVNGVGDEGSRSPRPPQ